ncbi:MAG: integrase core domain-containing protein [Dermatophilaceae bacterium]
MHSHRQRHGVHRPARLHPSPRRPQRLRNRTRPPGRHPEELPPHHPTTCGKVERFQQTLKTWLTRQPHPPATIDQLQALIDRFRTEYNQHRPHRALHRATPTAAYQARPKATPTNEPPDRTHTRIRTDKVNNGKITLRHSGTLYSIGIGRHHNGLTVKALIHGLHITIVDATTGEVLRQLTLDTTRKYQPQPQSPNPHGTAQGLVDSHGGWSCQAAEAVE